MRFSEYMGVCSLHHLRQPRFFPLVDVHTGRNADATDWKKRNSEVLFEKIRRQLRNFPRNKIDSLLDTLEVNVRFGRFYLVDPGCKLHELAR